MKVTQIIREGDGFDSKDDHEFMHDVRQYYAYRSMQQKFQVILGKLECLKNRSWFKEFLGNFNMNPACRHYFERRIRPSMPYDASMDLMKQLERAETVHRQKNRHREI